MMSDEWRVESGEWSGMRQNILEALIDSIEARRPVALATVTAAPKRGASAGMP